MEAFSLLKYWKSGAGVHGGATSNLGVPLSATPTTTIVTAVGSEEEEEDSSSDGGNGNGNDNDDGPFFDLEFAVPDNGDGEEGRETVHENEIEFDEDEVEERELSCFSPSDDLFFKGKIVAAEEAAENDGGGGMKSGQFQVPASLVKSATKLRVFMLNLKRSKSDSKHDKSITLTTATNKNRNSKFLMVKLRIEDAKGLISRASSSSKLNIITKNRCNAFVPNKQQQRQQQEEGVKVEENSSENCENEEKKIKHEVVQKYLKMVKPLYVKISKRNNDSETKEELTAVKSEEKVEGGGVKMNLKVMAKKHLGKSKSGVVHSMPNHNHNHNHNTVSSKKRDDSLLEQQDGIQSAILHCKRSFNSSSSSDDGEETTSVLSRSASDPSHEKKSTVTSAGEAELMMFVKEE